jgi:hypothetical protein
VDFTAEDGDSMFLRNDGIYLEVHPALLPRRPTSVTRTRIVTEYLFGKITANLTVLSILVYYKPSSYWSYSFNYPSVFHQNLAYVSINNGSF